MNEQSATFVLPALVMTPGDVSRLLRELAALDDYLVMQTMREPGVPTRRLPRTSHELDELAATNQVNLLHKTERDELVQRLEDLRTKAPVLHVSFAVDPSPASLQKIVLWLRKNIHADALVHVGLQPNIVAGCVVRTTNRYFDLSLRHYLQEHRQYLVDSLASSAHAEPATSLGPEVAHE